MPTRHYLQKILAHMKNHAGERLYQCSNCDRDDNKKHLKNHMLTDTGENHISAPNEANLTHTKIKQFLSLI